MIGYLVVSANTEVTTEENIVDIQNELQKEFKSYGYTIDNPNIILNPYEISPLTALIIFETPKEEKVNITILGKDNNNIETSFEKTKIHYIPIYGLYPDYKNKIKISSGNTTKEIEIKTDKIPDNINKNSIKTNNEFNLTMINNYPVILDKNNIFSYAHKKYFS